MGATLHYFLSAVFMILVSVSRLSKASENKTNAGTSQLFLKFIDSQSIAAALEEIVDIIRNSSGNSTTNFGVGRTCYNDLQMIVNGISNGEAWALKSKFYYSYNVVYFS